MNNDVFNNDFITIWSRYLTTGNFESTKKRIKKLARFGQLDAMVKWYDLSIQGECKEIDRIADTFIDSGNYKKRLVFACSHKNQKIVEMINEINGLYAEANKTTLLDSIVKKDKVEKFNKCLESADEIKKELMTMGYVYQKIGSLYMLKSAAESDIIVLQEYTEELEKFLTEIHAHTFKLDKTIKANYLKVKNSLLKKYAHSIKTNTSLDAKTEFALAKSILQTRSSEEEKSLSKKLLAKLSQREFSAILKSVLRTSDGIEVEK